jgi:hypothetical protein
MKTDMMPDGHKQLLTVDFPEVTSYEMMGAHPQTLLAR